MIVLVSDTPALLEMVKAAEQRKLQITDVKTLFNVAMITLDAQAHQMELKQEQLSFLNAADASEAVPKVGCQSVQREYPIRSRGMSSGTARFLTDLSTELECKVIAVAETAKKGKDESYINPVNSTCICQYVNHQCKMASCVWKEIDGATGLEMWLQAKRDIKQGEELTLHYGMQRHLMLAVFGTP
eukprot:921128-Rhodomonas_salina.1